LFSAVSRERRIFARRTAPLMAVLAVSGGAEAGAFEIAPHRAIYTLDLISTSNASAVADVDGEMMFQWADSCDGWTVEQRYQMNFVDAEGRELRQSSVYATWESKDGNDFTFTLRNMTNGAVDEEVRGNAALKGEGQGGTVTFRLPEEVSQELPPGTIFPTAHTLRMLRVAEKPGTLPFFNAMLFDGTGLDSLREINAVVGDVRPMREHRDFPLLNRPFWPVGLAFYPEEESQMLPEYEMSVNLFDNGVVTDMTIDYGTFAVGATLNELAPLDSDC
jgi:hypothetical protein